MSGSGMRRRTAILLIVPAIVALVLLLPSKSQKEPHYSEHSLSYWLNAYGAQWYGPIPNPFTPEFDTATNALAQIGTNAVPFLLKWMSYERPSWRGNAIRRIERILNGRENI